jgi:hypothetical protein
MLSPVFSGTELSPGYFSAKKEVIFEIIMCAALLLWGVRYLAKEMFDFCEECRERIKRWRNYPGG